MRWRVFGIWLSLLSWVGADGLQVGLDPRGPYVILVSPRARQHMDRSVTTAQAMHPQATVLKLDPERPQDLLPSLRKIQPRYAMLVLRPEEINVHFAWRWLRVSTALDDDPLVDVRSGLITGVDDAAATALLKRTQQACQGKLKLPAALIDNFGPNSQFTSDDFQESRSNFMLPIFSHKFRQRSISHGSGGFSRPEALNGAGLIHLGGHGTPERIVDGLTARQLSQLPLSPCVVFNGACYTGVTGPWIDQQRKPRQVAARHSFCLQMLQKPVIGYLAALHPDHGMPVYQELEFLAVTGSSLGDVIKYTHDGVVLGSGGRLPELSSWSKAATPAQMMLSGTGSRVLFGDPALKIMTPITTPPFAITHKTPIQFTARPANPQLTSTFTDTYHSDLGKGPFNDRALLQVELPQDTVSFQPQVLVCRSWLTQIPYRVVGWALEKEGPRRIAHLQIDVPASGMFQSSLRQPRAQLEVRLTTKTEGLPSFPPK